MKTLKKISRTSFLIFILIFPIMSEAQLLNRIKKAAERGVSNAVEKKVETEAQKLAMRQMEKMFQNLYGDDFENQAGIDFSKIMSGINANVETADNYDFTGNALMTMKSTDEKGKSSDPLDVKSFFSDNSSIMAMEMIGNETKQNEDGNMIMIYDFDRNASIILMDNKGEKSRMAYGFDFEKMGEGINTGEMEDMEDMEDMMLILKLKKQETPKPSMVIPAKSIGWKVRMPQFTTGSPKNQSKAMPHFGDRITPW